MMSPYEMKHLHDFRISWFRVLVNGTNEILLNHMKLREPTAEMAEFNFRREYPKVDDYELVEI
jgi:hypothetical protein